MITNSTSIMMIAARREVPGIGGCRVEAYLTVAMSLQSIKGRERTFVVLLQSLWKLTLAIAMAAGAPQAAEGFGPGEAGTRTGLTDKDPKRGSPTSRSWCGTAVQTRW